MNAALNNPRSSTAAKAEDRRLEKKLDTAIELLQYLVVLQLWHSGVNKEIIGKHIHVAKAKVVSMLRGVKRTE